MQGTFWRIGLVACAIAVLSGCGGAQAVTDSSAREPSQLCVVRHAEAFKNLDPRPADLTAAQLDPGDHAIVVTHADIAALLVGELRGTPLRERPTTDALGLGEAVCLPLSASGEEVAP
jgi:hypothetical protein